jgi:hypothetical protein
MSNLILRDFHGKSIRHRADGFMSLTDMCDANGKLFGNWNKLQSTKEYLKALQDKHYSDQNNGPIESKVGGTPEATGTWGDRRVAMRLAQWLSPEFAIQVDEWIVELMNTGTVSIASQPVQPVRQLAPQRDLKDWIDCMAVMKLTEDPILKSLVSQRMAEQLGIDREPAIVPCVLTVRAIELGVSQSEIGSGSQLGKFIVARGFASSGKSQHGKYQVNCYDRTAALDAAILNFFGRSPVEALAVVS